MEDHIKYLKGKVEGAYQTILSIAGNSEFKRIEMESIWELIENTIAAIITYGSETWTATKKENTELNKLLDNIIKRILLTPPTTPREALYIETGLLDPETISKKQRINMDHKLKTSQNPRYNKMAQIKGKKSWKETTDKTLKELNISEALTGKKDTVKRKIKQKTMQYFKSKIEKDGENKSKVKYLLDGIQDWKPCNRQKYMMKLSRINASTIFKARTRMIDAKNNFRGMYEPNLLCRACKVEIETQEHILEECPVLHPNDTNKTMKNQIFEENTTLLKTTAQNIRKTMEKLYDLHSSHEQPSQRERPCDQGDVQR